MRGVCRRFVPHVFTDSWFVNLVPVRLPHTRGSRQSAAICRKRVENCHTLEVACRTAPSFLGNPWSACPRRARLQHTYYRLLCNPSEFQNASSVSGAQAPPARLHGRRLCSRVQPGRLSPHEPMLLVQKGEERNRVLLHISGSGSRDKSTAFVRQVLKTARFFKYIRVSWR